MICLNKSLFLTSGNPVGIPGILSGLAPSASSYTAVLEPSDGSGSYYAQVTHQRGGRSAHFSFLFPELDQENDNLLALIDFLSFQAGEMGALNVLAEVEESHPVFELFLKAGFTVYSWEAIWKLPSDPGTSPSGSNWSNPSAPENNTIRCLFQTLVPPLVQNAEPFTNGDTLRQVYKKNGEIVAYIETLNGPEGVYLIPLIHPSVEDVDALLADLFAQFKGIAKPVYMQVRSYQAWLSDALQRQRGEPSSRFALLVKHLAVGQLNAVKAAQRARSDQRQTEPTAPILNNIVETETTANALE